MSTFDWESASQGGQSEKMVPGFHYAEILRVVMGSKKGPFRSRSGDPQIMVIFGEEDGSEASTMLTLSTKAAWTLARLLSCCGVDLVKMKADGVEPSHFSNESLAKSYLVGKLVWIKVEPDGEYQKVTPLKAEDVPESVRTESPDADFPPEPAGKGGANPFA